MKMKFQKIAAAILMLFCFSAAMAKDLIDDADLAKNIARLVLVKVYGEDRIKNQEPLTVTEEKDTWFVTGTLQCAPQCRGGTASLSMRKKDGAILSVFHTK